MEWMGVQAVRRYLHAWELPWHKRLRIHLGGLEAFERYEDRRRIAELEQYLAAFYDGDLDTAETEARRILETQDTATAVATQ